MSKDLKHLNLPPATSTEIIYLDKSGKECEEKNAITKKVIGHYGYEESSTHYFIKYGSAELLDPHGVDSTIGRSRADIFKFKKVTEKAYNAYEKYLQTKNRIHFTTARRLIME